jgi:hypothetical protein
LLEISSIPDRVDRVIGTLSDLVRPAGIGEGGPERM